MVILVKETKGNREIENMALFASEDRKKELSMRNSHETPKTSETINAELVMAYK